jgi:hypothetical protein
MNARDLFRVVAKGIGLWLVAQGIIELSVLIVDLIFQYLWGTKGLVEGLLVHAMSVPIFSVIVGLIILFQADGLFAATHD